ncbi:hypothetical protein LTR74_016037 [Friedmanniomyces endolithicus]|nr:hypothetical protein LTR74_016037 [Friedmanniomyces endolithicus]
MEPSLGDETATWLLEGPLASFNLSRYHILPVDQSSGKSSVLEGLVAMAFPRTVACVHVSLLKSEQPISVSIIADQNSTQEQRAEVEAWSKKDLQSLDGDAFPNIKREVHEVMGLNPSDAVSGSNQTFSSHVLRLEIAGPNQEHLSVTDVPGIFRIPTPGLTTKSDFALVKNMVLGYMDNPRWVMLTVVSANVDIATQEIIDFAAEVDPTGDRTLGVRPRRPQY